MSPKTLKDLKESLKKLYIVYEVLALQWNGVLEFGCNATYPEVVIVSVLLQNMQFDGSDCYGYEHEKDVKDLYNAFETLRALNEYHGRNFMTHFAFNEAHVLIICA